MWTLKLGSVVVTLASTAGFWHYVTGHVHPVRAPLKPKVVLQPVIEDTAGAGDPAAGATQPSAPPVVIKKVVVIQQQQVQSSAALGANWIANRTGQQPVQSTHTS